MINKLLEHKTETNKLIVESLIDFIEYKNITSVEELGKYQFDVFTTDDKNKQILVAKHIINNSLLDLDNLDYSDSARVYLLKQKLDKISDPFDLFKCIVTIFTLTDKNLMFYLDIYNYILEGKL